jgi:hypothetical protein
MKLDIFGDSFSHELSRFDDSTTWLDLLIGYYDYDIRNFSADGVGAQYCIEKFMQLDEYGDCLLYMIPDLNRLNLEYIKDKTKASETYIVFKQMEKQSYDFPNHFDKLVVDEAEKIYQDYKGFYNTELHKILEPLMIQFVFSRAKDYEKILIWPSSGLGYPFYWNSRSIYIPDNCHIVNGSLHIISSREINDSQGNEVFGKDTRNNHLSSPNHEKLAHQINQYFLYDMNPDPDTFLCGLLPSSKLNDYK